MTPKQQKFCDEYLISGNATDAARKAGYSAKTAGVIGNENLKKPVIRAYISEAHHVLHSAKVAQKEEIMEYLTRVMQGKEEGAKVSDSIKAAELLGKHYALFTDKVKVGSDGRPFEVNIKVVD